MKHALILMAALGVALAACGEGEVLDAADDSMTSDANNPLSTSMTIGTTLITTANVNLRSGAGTSHSVITVIPSGTRVSLVFHGSPTNGFYNVLSDRHIGWSSGLYLKVSTPPSKHTLDTSVVSKIVEPPGSGTDDSGHSFTDKNYWNFCAPGAAAAVLSYFNSNTTHWPAGHFKEPYGPHIGDSYWASSDSVSGYSTVGRAYLMHLATQVKPPNFSTAGMPGFGTYPTLGTKLDDSRDALNWEASGHASDWNNFFYERVSASVSATTLHDDIRRDISGGHAVLASVDTIDLPNWSRSVGHAIAIVGYDDVADTYAYVDTCGRHCNGASQSTNGGVWHISQSKLHSAISRFGDGYIR